MDAIRELLAGEASLDFGPVELPRKASTPSAEEVSVSAATTASAGQCPRPCFTSFAGLAVTGSLAQRLDVEAVKAGDAVGLGPEGNPALPAKGPVRHREELLAVKGDPKALPFGPQGQGMPVARGDPRLGARDLFALSPDHAVEAHVVLQGLRAT